MVELDTAPLDIPYAAPTLGDLIEKLFANLQVTPNDDPALAYRLGVPAQWVFSRHLGPVVEELLLPEGLGFFAGQQEPGYPVIAVTVTRFPFEMPVDAWVKQALAQQGYTLVAGRYFPGPHSIERRCRIIAEPRCWRDQRGRAGDCRVLRAHHRNERVCL